MQVLGKAIDKAMGPEVVLCDPADPQVLALLEAGFDIAGNKEIRIKPSTKLSSVAQLSKKSKKLLEDLRNLDSLYVTGESFERDLLHADELTIGDVIAHLDQSQVKKTLGLLHKEQRKAILDQTHDELDALLTESKGGPVSSGELSSSTLKSFFKTDVIVRKLEEQQQWVERFMFCLGLVSAAMAIPQIISIYMAKDSSQVSLMAWGFYAFSALMWIFYGAVFKRPVVKRVNAIFLISNLLVVIVILMFR